MKFPTNQINLRMLFKKERKKNREVEKVLPSVPKIVTLLSNLKVEKNGTKLKL